MSKRIQTLGSGFTITQSDGKYLSDTKLSIGWTSNPAKARVYASQKRIPGLMSYLIDNHPRRGPFSVHTITVSIGKEVQ